ncbi:MAG: GatB/YqeY domain-containing protein [Pedobacter sp.]|nr:MAG: GatB/YqeY domain-containing protein [Pedobacter sp.]
MMLSENIDKEIKSAMLSKDQARLRGLRAIKAAFLLAKTEKGGASEFDSSAEIKILQKLVKQRKESAAIYEQQGRKDLYQVEAEEIEVIEGFLPAQLSEADVRTVIERVISGQGGATMKDMGKIMGLANAELSGKADGKMISEIVKSTLSS